MNPFDPQYKSPDEFSGLLMGDASSFAALFDEYSKKVAAGQAAPQENAPAEEIPAAEPEAAPAPEEPYDPDLPQGLIMGDASSFMRMADAYNQKKAARAAAGEPVPQRPAPQPEPEEPAAPQPEEVPAPSGPELPGGLIMGNAEAFSRMAAEFNRRKAEESGKNE